MEEILYAAIEVLERLEAGIPVASLLDGRLLTVGVVVQVAIAVGLAVLLAVVPGPRGARWRT